MGCDIHSRAERFNKESSKWEKLGEIFPDMYEKNGFSDEPFESRSYSVFGFLAGVRNYSHCDSISEPRGIPEDVDDTFVNRYGNTYSQQYGLAEGQEYNDYHSHSWLTAKELIEFDYDKIFWDRRVTKQTGPNSWTGAGLAEEGEGENITYREHLGSYFFEHLNVLKELEDKGEVVRIVFCFDN